MIIRPEQIHLAVKIIKKGGSLIYPTETFYGLGVNALDEMAVKKIFYIKKRPFFKPISVIIPDKNWVKRLAQDIPQLAYQLMDTYWPGPLTLILKARPHIPTLLTAGSGKIGMRISSHPLTQKLVKQLDLPLTATSANLSGQPPAQTLKDISEDIKKAIDAIIDAGSTPGGLPSTVIDLTIQPPRVIRNGAVKFNNQINSIENAV